MTLDDAKALAPGDMLYHGTSRNADGTPQRLRVTGRVKTWVRDPNRVQIPVKRGMYETGVITEHDLMNWFTSEEDAISFGTIRAEVPPLEEKEEKEERRIRDAKDLFVYAIQHQLQQSAEKVMHFLTDEGYGSWIEMMLDRWKRKLPPFRTRKNPGDPQLALELLSEAESEIKEGEDLLHDNQASRAAIWASSSAQSLQEALREIQDLPPGPRVKNLLARHSALWTRLRVLQDDLRQIGAPTPTKSRTRRGNPLTEEYDCPQCGRFAEGCKCVRERPSIGEIEYKLGAEGEVFVPKRLKGLHEVSELSEEAAPLPRPDELEFTFKRKDGSVIGRVRVEPEGLKPPLARAITIANKKWNLGRANLIGAYLIGANLGRANLRDANLGGADLRDANLGGADLRGAHLRGANLTDANLTGADLGGADLRDANLTDANLRDANLRDADLGYANLAGADLTGAQYRTARNINLTGAIT